MKGLDLSRRYFEAHIERLLTEVPEARGHIAAGLAGEGSQCFSFDDEISQDHDFGPGFCIWLSDKDYTCFGEKLQGAYDALPDTFCGYSRKNIQATDRVGVMRISEFYARFTGSPSGAPETLMDWLLIPEYHLAAATNGQVFQDNVGVFTDIRSRLSGFYPEDVRRKKIAARAAVMSQAGQYNLLRCIKREDTIAALLSLSRFTEAALSMVYLLNRQYTPFYKWAYHGLKTSGHPLAPPLEDLSGIPGLLSGKDFSNAGRQAFRLTESICCSIAENLHQQGISTTKSEYLQDHLPEIMAGIKDPQLRNLPPMLDCQN